MQEQGTYARYTREGSNEPELGLLMEAMADDAKGYMDAQRDLVVLAASEKAGRLVAIATMALGVGILLGGVLVMLSVALALWLGALLSSLVLGFLATAGLHLVLAIAFYFLWKHQLREKIILALINAAHDDD
ncbi:MAG: hypothetical protein KF905_06525 [Flavobacteriales bacterium]|nr:hypothetical protein [Flavobacteriales bacterium]